MGWDRRLEHAQLAKSRGAVSDLAPSLAAAIAGADLIILAVPLRTTIALIAQVIKMAQRGALILDVAGLKEPVIAKATAALKKRPDVAFIGGHPLAGLERGGPQSALADIFRGRAFALCAPPQPRRAVALRRADAFVRRLGAQPVHISARLHDRVISATSALPQLVASAVALAVGDELRAATKLWGPGYESVTRLARSPSALWAHGLIANRRNVRRMLAVFITRVKDFQSAIERSDDARLSELMRSAAAAVRRLAGD